MPALILWAVLLSLPQLALAHDIPDDVAVRAFVRPHGERLQLLVRVPLSAMREVDYPRRGPGYLDLARATPALHEAAALWISDNVQVFENERRLGAPTILGARVSLESDRSFGAFETALSHVTGPPLPNTTDVYWNQALLDVLLEYRIVSERSAFSIHPKLERLGLRTVTTLRFVTPEGDVRAFQYHGDAGVIRLDPRWHQAALRFLESGVAHILSGVDHLLFLLCLVLPFRRLWPLFVIVTGFTVAHSITLVAAALGLGPDALWFPPLIETLVAISILYMALENIFGARLEWRWIIACAFGLVHGFAFSFQLRESLQFAGSHLLTALLSFNFGIEIGQMLVLVAAVPLLGLLFRAIPERVGTIVVSAFVAHTAWHWMIERGEQLSRFPLRLPDAASLATATRWLMAAVALGAIVWLISIVRAQRAQRRAAQSADQGSAG